MRLRRVLAPQRDTVRGLADEEFPAISERARLRLRSAHDQYVRATESLDSSRALLAAVLETYRAVVAERANEVMKVLAVFAAILLPLSVMAGIYGMNFANMPELDWRWAYFVALGIMATVALALWLYFARRGFIGGPRLGRIPKAVGSGLAGLVRLTTLPVSSVSRMLTGKNENQKQ
jgi:magnesium transporter